MATALRHARPIGAGGRTLPEVRAPVVARGRNGRVVMVFLSFGREGPSQALGLRWSPHSEGCSSGLSG